MSSENDVHTAPPPIGIPFGFFQVSNPGSPGFGTVLNRQTGEPSAARNAPTHPCTLFSLPAGPISTRSSKTTGAMRERLAVGRLRDLARPQRRAGVGIEREQVAVGRAAEDAAVLDRDAAIALEAEVVARLPAWRHFTRQVAASSAIVLIIVVTYIVPL